MRLRDVCVLLASGAFIWFAGTVYYHRFGAVILETTDARYWRAFIISPIMSTLLSVGILKLMRIAPSEWASGLLLLAIPGMLGEALILSHWSLFMSNLAPASSGRYGAFLFATYGLVLSVAEIVSLTSRR